jgi:hypothetical protein
VTALVLGRPGVRELWDRQIRRPPRRRWYAIVLAVPIVYSLLAVAITLALGATTETDKLNKLAIFPALLIIRIVLAVPSAKSSARGVSRCHGSRADGRRAGSEPGHGRDLGHLACPS